MSVKVRQIIFWTLSGLFIIHSLFVFTTGTEKDLAAPLMTREAQKGKLLFQEYNCIACHQVYGLGGYMGPDLTNVISRQAGGELYVRAFLTNGTQRMPNYQMNEEQMDALVAYLAYVDKTGISPVKKFEINMDGTVTQK